MEREKGGRLAGKKRGSRLDYLVWRLGIREALDWDWRECVSKAALEREGGVGQTATIDEFPAAAECNFQWMRCECGGAVHKQGTLLHCTALQYS